MKVRKSLLTLGTVVVLGLSASIVSSNKVSAAEVGKNETVAFNVKENVLSFNQKQLFLESKAGGCPLGGGESPTNPIRDYYPWR